jgi:hypothetical protein
MMFSSVDLPEPFRPEHADLRAGKEIQRDVLDDRALGWNRLADPAHRVDVFSHAELYGTGRPNLACA